jgi:hypothetical protein
MAITFAGSLLEQTQEAAIDVKVTISDATTIAKTCSCQLDSIAYLETMVVSRTSESWPTPVEFSDSRSVILHRKENNQMKR